MLNYYLNLPKERELDFDKNINVSIAIQRTAKRAFEPFESYLTNAIRVLKKKDDVKAKWQKVKSENHAELRIAGKLFEVSNGKGQYKIVSDILQPDFSEPIIYKIGEQKGKVTITKEQYQSGIIQLDTDTENFDRVTWSGDDIALQPLWLNEPQDFSGIIIREENHRKIIYTENGKKPNVNAKEISGNKLVSFIDFDNLTFENGEKLNAERNEGLSLLLSHERDYNKVVTSNNIKFRLERPQKRDKDSFWIQLQELDDTTQGEDIPGFSPLRYFFDDDISIFDDNKTEYEVSTGRESENKIVLTRKGERYKYCFPPEGSTLTVKVNTYQLRKQLEAISTLMKMPVGEHGKLIKLFENKNDKNFEWETPKNKPVSDWAVITDETRSGCREQRQFARQAINTPDFAILEGPPGSGKTTVILELICQLVKQGKRILLCGSTHVAIDNVLERLKYKKTNEESLLEKYHILPVRIGDEKRINDDIREFQIDNLQNDNSITEKLLLDAANLVCGTTIGILQHPNFKQRQGKLNDEKMQYYSNTPIVPEFDYLIIDESSKTTFQEFLVPALYAKKWILAGDVMQLSPFTDREEIVSNISQLQIENKPLKFELQQAVFYLQKMKSCLWGKHNKFVLPVSLDIFNFIILELSHGRYNDFQGKTIFAVTNEGKNVDRKILYKRNINTVSKLELSAADIILIDESLLKQYIHLIPESHAVLRGSKWLESEHAFSHNAFQQRHKFKYKERNREFDNSIEITEEINKYFGEKNWAEEIAWRVDREHQLRLSARNKIKDNYSKTIDDLLPKSIQKEAVEEQINQIASMAFPSILESLVHGIKGRKVKVESTISEGFNSYDLDQRRTTLVYQHRMHPEISVFPRTQFYKESKALKDLETPQPIGTMRDWDYDFYSKRSVWIDVAGNTVRNYNDKEVNELISHLQRFIEFAKNNPQPENNKEWTVACLTFYRGQETKIREKLQAITHNENAYSSFTVSDGKYKINIKLHTVDKFQGHEADIVFLSMVQTKRDGFMDNPNRLNVAVTRAKFQLVIVGNYNYFKNSSQSEDLRALAENTFKQR